MKLSDAVDFMDKIIENGKENNLKYQTVKKGLNDFVRMIKSQNSLSDTQIKVLEILVENSNEIYKDISSVESVLGSTLTKLEVKEVSSVVDDVFDYKSSTKKPSTKKEKIAKSSTPTRVVESHTSSYAENITVSCHGARIKTDRCGNIMHDRCGNPVYEERRSSSSCGSSSSSSYCHSSGGSSRC